MEALCSSGTGDPGNPDHPFLLGVYIPIEYFIILVVFLLFYYSVVWDILCIVLYKTIFKNNII